MNKHIEKQTTQYWGRGPGFESGISHNDPDELQDHCDKVEKLYKRGKPTPEAKKDYKKHKKM